MMGWQLKRISANKERAAQSIRDALEDANKADGQGRGYGSAATAVETALQAFGHLNGYSIQVETSGNIAADGKGFLTISLHTIDPETMV